MLFKEPYAEGPPAITEIESYPQPGTTSTEGVNDGFSLSAVPTSPADLLIAI